MVHFFQNYSFLYKKTVSLLRSKQNSTYRGMTFIYFVTNSAWNPNTWAILCGILAVFLIVVLLTIYFIFRRLHIDLTICVQFSRTEAPFPPGNINDFRYTSGERDRRFTSSSGFRSQNKEATYLINYRRPSGDTPLPEADIQQRIQPTNGRKW